jgi:hypothetical protein
MAAVGHRGMDAEEEVGEEVGEEVREDAGGLQRRQLG